MIINKDNAVQTPQGEWVELIQIEVGDQPNNARIGKWYGKILLDICDSPADVLAKQNAELLAENDRLRAALEKYGRHHHSCAKFKRPRICTCGLNEVSNNDRERHNGT